MSTRSRSSNSPRDAGSGSLTAIARLELRFVEAALPSLPDRATGDPEWERHDSTSAADRRAEGCGSWERRAHLQHRGVEREDSRAQPHERATRRVRAAARPTSQTDCTRPTAACTPPCSLESSRWSLLASSRDLASPPVALASRSQIWSSSRWLSHPHARLLQRKPAPCRPTSKHR